MGKLEERLKAALARHSPNTVSFNAARSVDAKRTVRRAKELRYRKDRNKDRAEDGVCRNCGNAIASTSKLYCQHHLDVANERAKARYRAKKAQAAKTDD